MNISAGFKKRLGEFHLDAELNFPESGVTAIFGESGSGKTTLLRAIAGLDHISSGYLKVGDQVWQDNDVFIPTHRRSIGYVFQEASLFTHLNVQQNIEYGAKRANRRGAEIDSIERIIELLGLQNLVERKPSSLSGGERQRVAIARAFACQPRLMLMDEPLASLDSERKQEILPRIRAAANVLGIPIIYVSHSTDEVAQLANHIIMLSAGKVIGSGGVQTMLTNLQQPLAHASDAEAIIEAKVAEHDAAYHLSYLDFAGGRFAVSQLDRPVGSLARLRIAARDVSLTLNKQSETSILNIFPGRVEAIATEEEAQVTIRVLVGGVPLLARVTRKSLSLLDLQIGKRVFVQVKSAAVFI